MADWRTVLPVPGTNDHYTQALNNGILGPPPGDWMFISGGVNTPALDTSKQGCFRIAATGGGGVQPTLVGDVDGRHVWLRFAAGSGALTVTLPANVEWQETPPYLALLAGREGDILLRYDLLGDTWQVLHHSGWVPNWVAPTLGASITNLGAGWEIAGYRRDKDGLIHLSGVLAGAGLTVGATIFTLPAGFRPYRAQLFTGVSTSGVCAISVEGSGAVKVHTVNGTTFFSALQGARFPAGG